MPGRLEQYDDFPRIAENNRIGEIMPIKGDDAFSEAMETLDKDNANVALEESKVHDKICILFYTKKTNDVSQKVYRFIVVPEKRIIAYSRLYLEAIDVNEMRRKIFRRDRISNVKILDKNFKANQNMIGFAK